HSAATNQTTEQFEQFLRDSTNSLLSECAAGAEPLRPLRLLTQAGLISVITRQTQSFTAIRKLPVVVTGAAYTQLPFYITQAVQSEVNGSVSNPSAMYDVVHVSTSYLGDLGSAGALADLQPFISSDPQQVVAWSDQPPYDSSLGSMYANKVVFVPAIEYPLLMYVNWPLLTSVYNISRPVLGEAGRLSFYPDTWQELAAVMRQVNATASNPVTGMPRHALCIPVATDSSVVMYAVMASIMQTGGVTQGWLYDPLTLEPLTNNTAMLKVGLCLQVLRIMWELSPFMRSFETAPDMWNADVDMSACAIALAGPYLFKTLHPIYSNRRCMGKLPVVVTGAASAQLLFYITQVVQIEANGSASNSSAMYDVVNVVSNILGDLGSAGALADLQPFISSDPQQVVAWSDLPPYNNSIGSMYANKVVYITAVEYPLIMYVNWPLLTSVYNISRPVLSEAGRLSFYPDTWQELAAVMRQVNATASDPVTGRPRHALCIPVATDSSVVMYAVMASIMQTGGTSQGWLYDPLTLEPLTNNTAMLKVGADTARAAASTPRLCHAFTMQALDIMWELSPFMRSFDTAPDMLNAVIDMSACAIALAGPYLFKTLHPMYINRRFTRQLTMSPLPASTEVLDRSTMHLVPCTAQLCNSQRASILGGQLVNLSPSRQRPADGLAMTSRVPLAMQTSVYDLLASLSHAAQCVAAYVQAQYGVASTGLNSWQEVGYNFSDVQSYGIALEANLALPRTAMDFRVADSLKPLSYPRNALLALIGCSNPLVPRSAGSPADFAAAMTSMTSGLRAVRDSLGAAAFREQLWGTTGFVPPTQPPPPTTPSPPPTGGPALSTPLLATVIAVPVGVCLAVMVLLLVIIIHLRRNAKLQRSLMGHVLPPAAGDKATLVITDVQGSSKLWETLPAGVMEASMKVHDELVGLQVRRLALDSSGYQWATEGDSFLLCFHSPQAAVAFAIQLQDALLQCSQWASALMAAGSPGQPLCLALACLHPHPPAHPPSHPHWSSLQVDSPAPPNSLVISDRQQGGEAAGQPSPPASLASGQAHQEVSLDLFRATPGGVMGGPECTAPSSVWSSKLGASMVLPARQSSKSALLWQLHSRSLSQASGRSQKKGTVQQPGPVASWTSQPAAELGQGLLSLLASRPWQQQQTSVMASSSSLQGSDATDASLHQVHAISGLVAWQRLCELYREVEVEEPGALTVLAGLRVRVGMHTGLAADEVLVQSRMGASSTTYGGAALVLAKAVQACAHGGQITLSAATFIKLPVEELRAAGISVVHMGKHLVELGEGKGDTALDLYCATLDTAAHAHRLWALGPLRTARQLQPGVLQAPYGVTATVFMSVVGLAQLKAWDASLAKECLALYQATAQRVLLHVAGRQLPAGYLVSTADEDGMVLAAFSSSLQCLHWALLTLTTCMDLDWPQALLDSLLGEEMMTEQQGISYPTAADSSAAAAGLSAALLGQAGCSTVSPSHSVRLLRGLRLKAGVDVGEVACDLTPANGRFNYRGRCLNRAARINGLAASGQVWCSQTAWDHAHASCKPSQLYDTALVEASPAAAQLPTSSASWTEQARQKDSSVTMAKSAHSATLHSKKPRLPSNLRHASEAVASPAPRPAVLTVDEVTPCIVKQSGGNSLAEQWHQLEHQLHGRSQAGSKAEGEGADRLSTSFLCSQGQPLALPGLLPSLVARALGSRELRGIPGQVALVQVSLAAHTSRGQLEAADRLGLMAPGLELG
ncbi:hypothetical protein QJQ45_022269, partial [Haematococcus lacustris]